MAALLWYFAVFLYFGAAGALMLYGLNCYVMIFLFHRGRRRAARRLERVAARFGDPALRDDLPVVTTQIAVYNEVNVVERVIRAVCRMRYPRDRHEIQILDDSSDETGDIVDRMAESMAAEGFDVQVIRRNTRTGFKAGALAAGLEVAKGTLVAVFDADFVPPEDYLLRTVPFFMTDDRLALVQARWGHLNRKRSFLTRAQSIGIDGHFMVEQAARNWNNLYMNFNGTAGIWRRSAIDDGGGWAWDTLTEDMDLSYRVQFAGWRTLFLPDLVVPAEIPEDVNAFKSQQFRWAKGSIQTALKLFPRLVHQPVPIFQKIQAFFHMTHYLIHPMMLVVAVLALPVLLGFDLKGGPLFFGAVACILLVSMTAPNALYLVSQRAAYTDWLRRVLIMPVLVVVGVGIALSNTRAVVEALIGHDSPFIRTPKRGDREIKRYRTAFPGLAFAEILLGGYCVMTFLAYLKAGKYLIGPFLAVYAAGFLFVGLLTLAPRLFREG
ncbi:MULTISPECIES: glycosyltransferase [Desulfococcus]|jgi:cellulose synthase/poly-beta-1,6-N-acetylglucosamine synthase-like glycosyltransferase|uniref:Glycosyl transferase family 2 n=1 Tax=Desulfococcus multivorans DSM 2059 TaxID=1121405 RepID=S7VBJ1_DESML|nr:glycosyltransferase [Desulfococcus multivorans]AOY56808.1 glycosyl transferase, family 2 [Desulfococcus multivorans]AQU99355.1 glycosyl transferase family 2 [Desulfococcus multivorans]EPR41823.1 glycosyl transferase family 2 [Desulfococcus multivorans DSM 2059]MDX9819026.1 glycosyltransferase [Desulfococcus multivorans]SJZ92518.1 Glycosyltransferase, catalytic subunit of cellulose synthase and poly-beta-1,6-N-acetylglucosamine synthase [Desulfococcus multivorans DSM 2059]